MFGTLDDYLNQQLSAPSAQPSADTLLAYLRNAQSRPAPAAPNPPPNLATAPLPIPRARAPIFLSPPASPAPADAPAPPNAWDQLNNTLTNHAATLLALGAGIAQGGVGKGLALASTAADTERNRQAQQLNYLQTYKALTDGGVPNEEAIAAISNPSLMRALAAKYLGPRAQTNAPGTPAAPPSAASVPVGVSAPLAAAPPNIPPPLSGAPPIEGARQAPDGKWYVLDPNRPGKYLMVQ
jgi:hypothetical protein